jgi:uncharacterized protein YfaS (alpha-2-macroglobulin family)
MKKQILSAVILLAVVAPAVSQEEAEPYFSLSASRTFASNSQPEINLSASNVSSLDFRVYRVNDTVKFFEEMEDPRNFGRAPRPRVVERTLIERIRRWKRQLRASVRAGLRAQFTEPPHEHLPLLTPGSQASTRDTRYAEAPVLNPQQLVLTFSQPITTSNRWSSQEVKLNLSEKGVYMVEASRGDLHAYTIVMVSDLVLTSKIGSGRILNYVTDRASGEPVQGAELYMMSPGADRMSAKTSANGIAEFAFGDSKPTDVRLIARRGSDVAANALELYNFGDNQWTSYIYTDRPVYRPGHMVHFKGIFRLREPNGYRLPTEIELPVKIEDSAGNIVYQKQLALSRNGTVSGEFTLAANGSLGYYSIQFQAGERFMSGSFEVEEYKKPEYEVRVLPETSRVLQGTAISAVVDARYYFGEPVVGATVKYSVYREPYWFPLWYDPEDEDLGSEFEDEGYGGDEISQGEGRLGEDGKLRIRVPTNVEDGARDYLYRIEARVTDDARREISGTGAVIVTYGSFVLNASPESYVVERGARAGIKIEARDYDNRSVATPVRVELLRWDWRDPKKQDVVATVDQSTGADGTGRAELTIPNSGGEYRVRVTARTREGRTIRDVAYLWVAGATERSFVDPRQEIRIVPDKKTYRSGETAHLLVSTGVTGASVLVTVEGRELREFRVVRSAGSTLAFDLPVTGNDEPGLYVSAQYMREGTLYRGSKFVRVPAEDHKLNVAVTPDKPQYKPGETATYTIAATDVTGKPVSQAEFSLGVVDEAIYAIRKDNAPEMMREFFGRDYNHISTGDSLTYYFFGEAGRRRMQLAQLRPKTKLAQLKPERLALPKIRKAFPDTAFWAAEVITDAQGKAQAKVEFPDSLTTWRATARGVTTDTKVGSAVAKNITRKNLILRFSVPRFFTRGDEVVISALVHNYLATAQSTQISLETTGLDVLNGAPKTLTIAPRSEARVDWRVRANTIGTAKLVGRALGAEESDALEVELPVNAPGVKLSESKGGSMPAGSSVPLELTFPANIESGSRKIAIHVSPSIAGALFSAVEYLTTFPYGCVEQTMSSFLPNIIVQQTVKDLGLKANLNQAQLREKIGDGLDRLYSFQHRDGGWGWWETDESHPFMTAYVVAGLAQAQISGTSSRLDVAGRGREWIDKTLASDPKMAPDLRAYMVYALTLYQAAWPPEKASAVSLDGLYQDRAKLSPYGLALLGLALEMQKDPRTEQIAAALDAAAKQDSEQAWWPAERDELLDFVTDATPEATAFAARFLSHVRPASPLLPKAAAWLMNHRNEGYWWSSTKQTAMVIYGLADYLKVTKELDPDFSAKVVLNGREVLSQRFDAAAGLNGAELVVSEADLQQGLNQLQVTTDGRGRLYYSARAEYFSTEQRQERRGTISLNVLREYFRLVPSRLGDRIVYDTAPVEGPLASGDTIAVRLTVTGSQWSYLLVEDPIPAGMEFVVRDDKFELRNRPRWWSYNFTRREMHDDRMAIFERYFPAGQEDYFYLLKVVNPGSFYASPTRVQPMYQPSTLATSSGRQIEVQ